MAKSQAFDVTNGQLAKSEFKDREGLCRWLVQEIESGLTARSHAESEIKYAWAIYQQDRTRGRNTPWPDAADLTSPYGAEAVDAVHDRLMGSVYTEPVWTVEGWGKDAVKAPYVEEFHQRAQEEERMQGYIDEWVYRGLIEGVGTLEITEALDMQRERQQKRVKLQLHEGAPVMGEDGEPAMALDEGGQFIDAEGPEDPSAEVETDVVVPVRVGPEYDVISYMDFLTLPQHAKNRKEIWGYAKRFWRRVPQLTAKAKLGMYDRKAVELLGQENERETLADEAPRVPVVTMQEGPTAQKELFEVQFLADCDGKGERWYRATVSKLKYQLLRLKYDDRTTRYLQFQPFPKPGSAARGYSLITNKIITVIEEDTGIRNMRADRSAFKNSQPVLRQHTALWDPYEEPIGPGSVIPVRGPNEVTMLQGIEDVPASVMLWKQDVRGDFDRLLGTNDVALGQDTQENKTLGEVELRAGYSEVRMNVIMKRFAEPMEEVFQVRHTIWKRTLRNRDKLPTSRALVIGSMADGIEVTGIASDGAITEELLDGSFWGKPKGSVETADLNRQRQDFNSFLGVLVPLMQVNPQIAAIFQTIPAARSLVKTALKVNRVQDIQSFIGPESHGVFEQMEQQQAMQRAMQDPRMQVLMGLVGAGNGAPPPGMPGAAPAAPQGDAATAPQAGQVM